MNTHTEHVDEHLRNVRQARTRLDHLYEGSTNVVASLHDRIRVSLSLARVHALMAIVGELRQIANTLDERLRADR